MSKLREAMAGVLACTNLGFSAWLAGEIIVIGNRASGSKIASTHLTDSEPGRELVDQLTNSIASDDDGEDAIDSEYKTWLAKVEQMVPEDMYREWPDLTEIARALSAQEQLERGNVKAAIMSKPPIGEKTFTCTVAGVTGKGNTWTSTCELSCKMGLFTELPMRAMRRSFEDLTKGKAVFGNPGVGCEGPYTITELHIVEKK